MLIDHHLPNYEAREACSIEVNARWQRAYAAIREADLRDPIIDAFFALRELPLRILHRRREGRSPRESRITFGSILSRDPGWVVLEEVPGIELVVGSVVNSGEVITVLALSLL